MKIILVIRFNIKKCGDYRLVNKQIWFEKYAMPLLEDIFNFIG
jgi:hypothetical protein